MDIFEVEYVADEDTHKNVSKKVAKEILSGIDESEAIVIGTLNGEKTMLFMSDILNKEDIVIRFDGNEYYYKDGNLVEKNESAKTEEVDSILEEVDILLTDDERAELKPVNDREDESDIIPFNQIQENQFIEFAEDFYYGSVEDGADPILMGSTKTYAELETQGLINDDELEIPAGTQCRVEYIDKVMEILVLDFRGAKIRLEGDPAVIKFKLVGVDESKENTTMQIEDEVLAIINEAAEFEWEDYQDGTMGGFMKHLAAAFDLADTKNLEKLYKGFPEIYEKYAKFHGDVLNVLRGEIVDYHGLKEGSEYRFMQDFFYGDADDYFEGYDYTEDQKENFRKKFVSPTNEIVVPAGTKFSVNDTRHGSINIEVEGFDFDCIFENDEKFEEVI